MYLCSRVGQKYDSYRLIANLKICFFCLRILFFCSHQVFFVAELERSLSSKNETFWKRFLAKMITNDSTVTPLGCFRTSTPAPSDPLLCQESMVAAGRAKQHSKGLSETHSKHHKHLKFEVMCRVKIIRVRYPSRSSIALQT